VDHIHLSENAQKPDAHMAGQLRDFIRAGFVTYDAMPRERAQIVAFYNCMRMNYRHYNWLAFLDVDEFLVLRRCAPSAPSAPPAPSVLIVPPRSLKSEAGPSVSALSWSE
jgi:hypothetical protein